MSLVLVVVFVILMILVVPVGHALIIAGSVAVLWDGNVPLLAVIQQMFDQTQSFPMLALPFFMYRSLYKMHQLALHGYMKVTLDTLARLISRRTEPHVKLH